MQKTISIVQLSDLHIGKEGEDTRGVDVRANFLRGIKEIRRIQPDLLVISGDLCYESGEKEVYQWIFEHLESLETPYRIISGNHDNPALIAGTFGMQQAMHDGELYFSDELSGKKILFLDSTKGYCSETQLIWVESNLQDTDLNVIVFIHHPPALAGMPFMDNNYPYLSPEKIQEVFSHYGGVLPIFCGHYHAEKTFFKNNLAIHITPSCFFQLDTESSGFKVDHYRPAFRKIEWDEKGISTSVVYF